MVQILSYYQQRDFEAVQKRKYKQIEGNINEYTTMKTQIENKFTQISLLLLLTYGSINIR